MCGQREATVHLLELIDSQQKSVWLCNICASGRIDLPREEEDEPTFRPAADSDGDSSSLASFLGQGFAEDGQRSHVSACPNCGYEIKGFQDSNRFGCADCYLHFRAQILPILARFHRHASHVGKVPQQAGGVASRQGELTRLRVALEKAIRSESYEDAARLRDQVRDLLAARDRSRDEDAGGRDRT